MTLIFGNHQHVARWEEKGSQQRDIIIIEMTGSAVSLMQLFPEMRTAVSDPIHVIIPW
jgi:hypothetical protein